MATAASARSGARYPPGPEFGTTMASVPGDNLLATVRIASTVISAGVVK